MHDLGCVALAQGETAQATAQFAACLAQHRAAGDQAGAAMALYALGQTALEERAYARAAPLFAELHDLAQDSGDPRRVAQALHGAGRAALGRGTYRPAAAQLRARLKHVEAELADGDRGAQLAYGQRVALEREVQSGRALAALLADVAALATAKGEAERAACLWGAAQGQVEHAAWWLEAEPRHDLVGVICAPARRADYQALAARVRAQAGDTAYDAAWSAGQLMLVEQSIALAYEVVVDDG